MSYRSSSIDISSLLIILISALITTHSYAQNSVSLDGNWEFYPGTLLEPGDPLPQGDRKVTLKNYIGSWLMLEETSGLDFNYGTYRKVVTGIKPTEDYYFFQSKDILRSAKVFINGKELIERGRVVDNREDFVPSKSYIYKPFELRSDRLEILIQVSDYTGFAGGIWFPITIEASSVSQKRVFNKTVSFAGIVLCLLFLGAYHLVLYYNYRERKTFFYFAAYMLVAGTWNLTVGEIRIATHLFEWLGYFWHTKIEICIPALGVIAFVSFIDSLFPSKALHRVSRSFKALLWIYFVVQVLAPVYFLELTSWMMFVLVSLSFIYSTVVAVRALKDYSEAKYWLVGIAINITFTGLDMGMYGGVSDLPNLGHVGYLIVSFIQAGIVIFQVSKDEKQKRHAFEQLEKLVYPHQLEKMEHGGDLESTMPQGTAKACIICFDVVRSAKIDASKSRQFMDAVFDRCQEIMMINYDKDTLQSRGYRIKEVGDGFFCSVGFPFTSESDQLEQNATSLAFDFCRAFDECVQELLDEPVYCSIGISYDEVEAHYPHSGVRTYDLSGRGIVLSTRYEGIRNEIFKDPIRSNIISISENVYDGLKKETAERFIGIDLEDQRFAVRDDPGAKVLYLWLSHQAQIPEFRSA